MHKRLKSMREQLASAIEAQLCNLQDCDCSELGEAIDMLKDLEEALYFCTITEAMNSRSTKEYEWEMDRQKRDGWHEGGSQTMYYGGWNRPMMYKDGNYRDEMPMTHDGEMTHDWREGRSPKNRRMYMESKHTKDKATQLRELEKYMQELTSDMVEMIEDASPEEKQYLEKKISALASKIGQMK